MRKLAHISSLLIVSALPLFAAEKQPDISISPVTQIDDCTSPINLTITVTSITDIDVKSGTIELPPAYVHGGRPLPDTLGSKDVNVLNPVAYHKIYDGLPWYQGLWPISFRKTSDVVVTLAYCDAGDSCDSPKYSKATYTLPAEAPLSAVLIGGVVGVLIWFLLAWTLNRQLLWKGAIAAVVITLLTLACARLTTSHFIPLPVSIDVKDSFAGLLIGLAWPTAQKAVVSKVFAQLA